MLECGLVWLRYESEESSWFAKYSTPAFLALELFYVIRMDERTRLLLLAAVLKGLHSVVF